MRLRRVAGERPSVNATEQVTRSIDLQASNIAGLARPAYVAGARITRMFPFGPVPGGAVMVTMVSHEGICCIGINADAAAIPDVDAFARCIRGGFDEVRQDLEKAEQVSFPLTLLVLILAFGTAVAAGLPILLGVFSLVVGVACLIAYFSRRTDRDREIDEVVKDMKVHGPPD